jgi:hemerythrin-like domain-containing protein
MGLASRRQAILAVSAGALVLAPAPVLAKEGEDVSATEDLMREHGVLRRILVVYREAARELRHETAKLDAAALADAAELFRAFGEDYHETKLEEAHVFPRVKKAGGDAADMIDTLIAQHRRGREINAFVTAQCKGGRVADGARLADALEHFARMYEIHAAMEDTVVFQAWKKVLSEKEMERASDLFEDIEKQQFKGDGFDMGVDRIAGIEKRLGFVGLGRYTAPSPA